VASRRATEVRGKSLRITTENRNATQTGIVKWFNEAGFGFIAPTTTGSLALR
jgi:hypothetical protein